MDIVTFGRKTQFSVMTDDGDNQMDEKNDNIAHPGMVTKPEETPDFGRIQ